MSSAQEATQSCLFALSAAVGESIELDDQDECCLEFADGIELAIAIPPGSQALTLRAPVAPSGRADPDTLQAAMSLNYGRLPASHFVALDSQSGQLVLMATLRVDELSQEHFLELLGEFVELVPKLRVHLSEESPRANGEPVLPTGYLRA